MDSNSPQESSGSNDINSSSRCATAYASAPTIALCSSYFSVMEPPMLLSLGESSGARLVSTIRIGSFNIGVTQKMLEGKNKNRYLHNIDDVITLCVQDHALDMMCLCELGGHREGFQACRPPIRAEDLRVFQTNPSPSVIINNNYFLAWGFVADASQFGVQKLRTAAGPII